MGDGATLVGRERELEAIDEFLAGGGAHAVVLTGDPGIGKTTLFEAAIDRARERDLDVLRCGPAPAETQLAFAAASDLLAQRLPELRRLLAVNHIRALEIAFKLQEADEEQLDPHTVSAAFLSAVRGLAAGQHLVVAIDDAQWLDEASAAVLEFAIRRLRDESVTLLVASRTSVDGHLPIGLQKALPAECLRRIVLSPFSLSAVQRLLQVQLGTSYPRPTLTTLYASSGGNPFYALELARAIERRGGTLGAGERLPVPSR